MATGLLLGPLIASCVLISALRSEASSPATALPSDWLIEAPLQPGNRTAAADALGALVESRRGLVDLSSFCAVMLLLNVCASWWAERRYSKAANKPEGERASVPRSEARRFFYHVLFTLIASICLISLKLYLGHVGIGIWQGKFYFRLEEY